MATLVYNRPASRPSRAFNSALSQLLRDTQTPTPQAAASFVPAADVLETAQGFELHLALPGLKKEAVTIEFLDGQLVVSGTRPSPVAEAAPAAPAAEGETAPTEALATATFRRVETNYGAFRRSFRLPDTVSVKNIAAELTDGVLRVTLPFDTDKVTKQQIAVR